MCRVCIDHYQGHLVIAPITPREWGETDASAFCMLQKHLCCRKFIWKQMAAASGFPCKLPWTVISTEYVKNIIIALHLILWQGFNKSIIRTVSSLLQSEDPQMTCQQTAHSLFTDAYCTQKKKKKEKSKSQLKSPVLIRLAGATLVLWTSE